MVTLDVAHNQAELDASEVAHITKYREGGYRLANLSDGGGPGRVQHAPENEVPITTLTMGCMFPLSWSA